MKYLKRLTVSVAFSVAILCLHSCNFLNVNDYFEETMKYDTIFKTKRNIERYLWATASDFPDEGSIFGNNYTPGPFASDEGFCLYGTGEFRGMAYVLGEVTPSNLYGMNGWEKMYIIIRKVNIILARMDEAADMTALDKREMLGYIYFMRAYAYYFILMKYGPAVLLGDEVLETNEDASYYNRARATYDETAEYICQQLEKSAEYLPLTQPVSYFGRPTQGAAYGLVARIRLQHASPLFNGQSAARMYFGNWTRKTDGVHYISQQYDETRWAKAAVAAKRVIDMNRYSLHLIERSSDTKPLPDNVPSDDFPNGAGNIDPFLSYANMFNGESLPVRNPEFVWATMSSSVLNYTKHAFPVVNMGGWNGLGVTQKVIDAYRMYDGRTIYNSSNEYPYRTDGFMPGSDISFSGYTLKGDGVVHNMYVDREMRFYASIGFCGRFWTANSTSDNNRKNKTITYYTGGNSGKDQTDNNVNNYPITGYVLCKYVHPDDAWAGDNAQRLDKPYPTIRYAEILLSYVEALNNLTKTHTVTDESGNTYTVSRDVNEMSKYFNQVRYRAGLPGLTAHELASPETMQQLIEQELMVEFVFENRRYFDVRRWGKYEESEREPIMGMNTDAGKDNYYVVVPVNHSKARNRVVDKRLVFMPIALSELRKASLLDQNPGWQN
ncbi:MAG: RagB/SusD family nutrient uptake outer membrane protein [Prevotellaceae bacterium]|nr:RagB/SusD family nutrient uptake outer membrane protein [Prevotellaceae bacterium]